MVFPILSRSMMLHSKLTARSYFQLFRIILLIMAWLLVCNIAVYFKITITEDNERLRNSNPTTAVKKRGNYLVLENYIAADQQYTGNETVTIATHGTSEYLKFVDRVCQRWEGPVSLTVYVGEGAQEFNFAFRMINYLRQCGHACVSQNVSWHFISEVNANFAIAYNGESIRLDSPRSVPQWTDPIDFNCSRVDSRKMFRETDLDKLEKTGFVYPINVARNVARAAATTYYVFGTDLELFPSTNIIPRFLRMITESENPFARAAPYVYVLPIFELEKDVTPPEDKATMVKVLEERRAVVFRERFCGCFIIPELDTWVATVQPVDSLGIHFVTKRVNPRWEPFYIGTTSVPEYIEEQSWEGQHDKMAQVLEMCLLNYTFFILDNAFLVHSPGIKTQRPERTPKQLGQLKINLDAEFRRVTNLKMKYQFSNDLAVRCGGPKYNIL